MPLDESVFVHPQALVETDAIGARTRIWAFAHVLSGAVVGADCNLGDGVFVEAEAIVGDGCTIKNGVCIWAKVTLENHVFCGPNMVFTNDLAPRAHPDFRGTPADWLPTLVREGASIGANATIICGTTIGRWAFVGAGALVNKDVPDHAMVVGTPARRMGWVCRCAARLVAQGEGEANQFRCPSCDARYVATESGLVPTSES